MAKTFTDATTMPQAEPAAGAPAIKPLVAAPKVGRRGKQRNKKPAPVSAPVSAPATWKAPNGGAWQVVPAEYKRAPTGGR